MTQPDLPESYGVASVTRKHGCTLHIVHSEVHHKLKSDLASCSSAGTVNAILDVIYLWVCGLHWKHMDCVKHARTKKRTSADGGGLGFVDYAGG